jgi:hypothetical protein
LNVSTGITTPLDLVTEGPDGTYTFDYTSAGVIAGETIRITVNKTGFDGEAETVTV